MSSNNFNSDIIEATTKGVLEWSADRISNLVKSFKERKLAFIKEPKTIEIVREQYNSGESKFYQIYIKTWVCKKQTQVEKLSYFNLKILIFLD